MGTISGSYDERNCARPDPRLCHRLGVHDQDCSITPDTVAGRHSPLHELQTRVHQFAQTVDSHENRSKLDDQDASKFGSEVNLILSETVRIFESPVATSSEVQEELSQLALQLVKILDSTLVRGICHSQSSMESACAKHFNQILVLLEIQCQLHSQVNHTKAESQEVRNTRDSTLQMGDSLHLIRRMNGDIKFILLLKVFKQLGRLTFLQTSTVETILEHSYGALFKTDTTRNSKRFSLLLKSLFELLHEQRACDEWTGIITKFHTQFTDWLKGLSEAQSDTDDALPYLLMYCEYNSDSCPERSQSKNVQKSMTSLQLKNLADEKFLSIIRTSLVDENLLRRKQGLFILKTIISYIRVESGRFFPIADHQNLQDEEPPQEDLELVKGSDNFESSTLLWSTFFELFDILDEKQIHIIQPCLQKLAVMEDGTCKTRVVLPWYCILLHKMCHHDNRFIASQGIIRFLKFAPGFLSAQESESIDELVTKQCVDFVEFTILPIVKEKVGWLFRSGEEFFKCTKQLGYVVASVHSNLFQTIKFLMGFVTTSCEFKVMSPNSLFFMTSTLRHAVSQEKLKTKPTPVNTSTKLTPTPGSEFLQDLTDCLTYFNEYMRKGLPTLDKFFKIESQHHLMDVFCALMKEGVNCGVEFGLPLAKTERADKSQHALMSQVLRFIAQIDYTLFCGAEDLIQLTEQMSKFIFRRGEDFNFPARCEQLRSLETRGFMRLYFCKVCQDFELMAKQVKMDNHPYEVFSKLLVFGNIAYFCDALTDFLKCALHRQYITENQNQDSAAVKNCWNLLVKLFLKCLLLQEADSAYDISPSAYELHINSTISLLDVIIRTLPLPVIQHLNLQDETEELQSFLVAMREGLEWSDDIYIDKLQFRFFLIFAKLNHIYGQPLMPAFHISNFTDTFKNTDINAVQGLELSSAFRSEFQEQRLAALSQILLVNSKQGVVKYFETEKGICWWSSILDLVDKSGIQGIIPILEFASALIPFQPPAKSEIAPKIQQFVQLSWSNVFEMRKTEAFWTGFGMYVEFIFDPYFASTGIQAEKSTEIFERGERVAGLSLVLMNKVATLDISDIVLRSSTYLREIIEICTQATCFGPLLLENNKSAFEIWSYLSRVANGEIGESDYCISSGRTLSIAPSIFDANSKTRLLGLQVIMKVLNELRITSSGPYEETLTTVVEKLLDKNDEESKAKKRYFGDSATHRVKQRISQTLLVLQPYFTEGVAQLVTIRFLKSLTGDNPQPSVRYLMEWAVIRNLIRFPTLETFNAFFDTSKECSSTRIGFGAFFSTICLHVVLSLKNQEALRTFCQEAFSALSVLIMGQHSTVRPYAQICFRRVYQHVLTALPEDETLMKYEVVYKSLESHLQSSGEAASFINQKVENNFYMKLFDPVKHYTPKTIFIELPRLAQVCEDELANAKDLRSLASLMKCGEDTGDLIVPSYSELDKSSWHLKATSRDGREMGEENSLIKPSESPDQDSANVYQKKINPWKYLPISQDITDFTEELQAKKKVAAEDGLILVASLLEKLPNLGGLCRTCEIFGVSKYVISSLRYLADQTFQSLSVSSEKWVNIIEVPKNTLREFLATYASKGYTILGIEQVSESVPLSSYKFPKKSVLLLGHEKFGIPPELLQVVDQCLEIPQVGVTRSLNVHVTGALCIWQYASQHSLQQCID